MNNKCCIGYKSIPEMEYSYLEETYFIEYNMDLDYNARFSNSYKELRIKFIVNKINTEEIIALRNAKCFRIIVDSWFKNIEITNVLYVDINIEINRNTQPFDIIHNEMFFKEVIYKDSIICDLNIKYIDHKVDLKDNYIVNKDIIPKKVKLVKEEVKEEIIDSIYNYII